MHLYVYPKVPERLPGLREARGPEVHQDGPGTNNVLTSEIVSCYL